MPDSLALMVESIGDQDARFRAIITFIEGNARDACLRERRPGAIEYDGATTCDDASAHLLPHFAAPHSVRRCTDNIIERIRSTLGWVESNRMLRYCVLASSAITAVVLVAFSVLAFSGNAYCGANIYNKHASSAYMLQYDLTWAFGIVVFAVLGAEQARKSYLYLLYVSVGTLDKPASCYDAFRKRCAWKRYLLLVFIMQGFLAGSNLATRCLISGSEEPSNEADIKKCLLPGWDAYRRNILYILPASFCVIALSVPQLLSFFSNARPLCGPWLTPLFYCVLKMLQVLQVFVVLKPRGESWQTLADKVALSFLKSFCLYIVYLSHNRTKQPTQDNGSQQSVVLRRVVDILGKLDRGVSEQYEKNMKEIARLQQNKRVRIEQQQYLASRSCGTVMIMLLVSLAGSVSSAVLTQFSMLAIAGSVNKNYGTRECVFITLNSTVYFIRSLCRFINAFFGNKPIQPNEFDARINIEYGLLSEALVSKVRALEEAKETESETFTELYTYATAHANRHNPGLGV